MPPGLSVAVRFAPGERLRYTLALAPPVRSALAQANARAGRWLAMIDGSTVTVDAVSAEHCAVRIESEVGRARVEARPRDGTAGAEGFDVHASLRHDGEERQASLDGVVIMLGGRHEAIFAQRGEDGPRYLMRLRYDVEGAGVEMAVYTAPFAAGASAAVRAALPAVVTIGRLESLPDGGAE